MDAIHHFRWEVVAVPYFDKDQSLFCLRHLPHCIDLLACVNLGDINLGINRG
jgi:hypothetical protein